MDRRREIKQNHPEISFPEVTRILGQEWSSMDIEVKEVQNLHSCFNLFSTFDLLKSLKIRTCSEIIINRLLTSNISFPSF